MIITLLLVSLSAAALPDDQASTGTILDSAATSASATNATSLSSRPRLISAAAGEGVVRVHWSDGAPRKNLALYASTRRADLFLEAPIAQRMSGNALSINGLLDGVPVFIGLAVVPDSPGSAPVPVPPVLTAVPGPPIYVDPDANAALADGTLEHPYSSPFLAALITFVGGGGNLWFREGTYDVFGVPLGPGVHLYGGFKPGFVLEERNPLGTSIWRAPFPGVLLQIQADGGLSIVDGLVLDGDGAGTVGIDVSDSELELRCLDVAGFTDRGIRVRNDTDEAFDITVVHANVSANGADGMNIRGGFDLFVYDSVFEGNRQEGLELDDLVALPGETATLEVSECAFRDNGAQGIDADLGLPPIPGAIGGRYSVRIDGTTFEGNASDGLLIDIDYELAPAWDADIIVRECSARANGASGFHIDADGKATIALHNLLASANAGDGILVTSEDAPGFVVISDTVSSANSGAGMRSRGSGGTLGQRMLAVSGSIVSGNVEAGVVGRDIKGTVASSIAHLQRNPWIGSSTYSSVLSDSESKSFVRSALDWRTVLSSGPQGLTLSSTNGLFRGSTVELDNDGIARRILQVSGGDVTLDPPPAAALSPLVMASFPRLRVDEDYRLVRGAPAIGAGLSAPGGKPVDAGAHGSSAPGAPGADQLVDERPFLATEIHPSPSIALPAAEEIVISFSDLLSVGASGPGFFRVVRETGEVLAARPIVEEERLRLLPPDGGWPSGLLRIELNPGIESIEGTLLAAPLVFEYRSP